MSRLAEYLNRMGEDERKLALGKVVSCLEAGILKTLSLEIQPEQRHLDKLHGLLTESVWMEAHLVEDGHYRNFLNEVQLAWQVACKVGEKIEPMRSTMIARQVRYALLQTSMNSLSSNIHPDTLTVGLRTHLWDEDTALTYAQSVKFGMTKVTMLTEIATFLREQQKDELAQEVFLDTLAAMREIDHQSDYVRALMTLIQPLPPHMLMDALAMIQEIADRDDRAKVLSSLVPHLSADLLEEALEVARDIGNADSRAHALRAFAQHLPTRAPHLLNRFFQIVQGLSGEGNQASILITSAPYFPSNTIIDVLSIVQNMYDSCYRVAVLLAFQLYEDPEKRLAAATNALLKAQDAYDIEDRAKGIALLAPYVPEELLPQAFTIARKIGDRQPYDAAYRTKALVALAPRLSDELQAEMIAEVQRWNIYFFPNISEVMVALIPHLAQRLFPLMLAFARSIIQKVYASEKMAHSYIEDQVPRVLVALFPHLPRELMPEALAVIEDIEAELARGYALVRVAHYLPEELIPRALELVRQLRAVHRVRALIAFEKRGLPSLLDEALRSAQQIQEADNSTMILPGLLAAGASAFPPERRSSVIDEALKLVGEIDDAYYRAEALLTLVAYLAPERSTFMLQEALQAAREIDVPQLRFSILHKIIPLLPPEQRPDIVNEALQVVQEDLEEDGQGQATARAMAMSLLAPFLSEIQREKVLRAAKRIRDPMVRSRILVAMALSSSSEECSVLLQQALKSARRIEDEERSDRFETLAAIALCLPDHQKHSVFVETLKAAEKVGPMYRSELGPTLAQLFSDFPPDLLPAAASLARQLWSPQALAALVPRVPPEERSEMLDDALAAARQLKTGLERARLLAILVPHATPDRQLGVLEEALHAIQQVDTPVDWSRFSQIVWSLASIWAQLPQEQAYSLWVSVLETYAKYRRAYFLAALVGLFQVIVVLGGLPAVIESINATLDICCHWSWSYRRT